MGFVTDELNETERQQVAQNKVRNMAVVYGKEAAMWKVIYKCLLTLICTFFLWLGLHAAACGQCRAHWQIHAAIGHRM